jgi:hypothetical protein
LDILFAKKRGGVTAETAAPKKQRSTLRAQGMNQIMILFSRLEGLG